MYCRAINSEAILIGKYKVKIINYIQDGNGEIVYVIEKLSSKIQSIAYEHHLKEICNGCEN